MAFSNLRASSSVKPVYLLPDLVQYDAMYSEQFLNFAIPDQGLILINLNVASIYLYKYRFYFKIRFAVLKLTVLKFCPYPASLIIGFFAFSIFSDTIHRLMRFLCVPGDIVRVVSLRTYPKHDILFSNKRQENGRLQYAAAQHHLEVIP